MAMPDPAVRMMTALFEVAQMLSVRQISLRG
jgi:hypothetical protein